MHEAAVSRSADRRLISAPRQPKRPGYLRRITHTQLLHQIVYAMAFLSRSCRSLTCVLPLRCVPPPHHVKHAAQQLRSFTQTVSARSGENETEPGFYSHDNIEQRLNRKPRGAGRPTQTAPPLTEEDHWAAAGAPAYTPSPGATTEELTTGVDATIAPLIHSRHRGRKAAATLLAAATDATSATTRDAPAMFSSAASAFPYVRLASAAIKSGTLLHAIKVYELSLLPEYARMPGCLSARLLVDGIPAAAAPADIAASLHLPANRNNEVTLVNLTTWASEGDCVRATEDRLLQHALRQLASFFVDMDAVKIQALRQVAASLPPQHHQKQPDETGGGGGSGGAVEVGEELGLR